MPKVPYPYEVNGKLVTGNGSLIPICSLSNRSLLPSLTVLQIEMIKTRKNKPLLKLFLLLCKLQMASNDKLKYEIILPFCNGKNFGYFFNLCLYQKLSLIMKFEA